MSCSRAAILFSQKIICTNSLRLRNCEAHWWTLCRVRRLSKISAIFEKSRLAFQLIVLIFFLSEPIWTYLKLSEIIRTSEFLVSDCRFSSSKNKKLRGNAAFAGTSREVIRKSSVGFDKPKELWKAGEADCLQNLIAFSCWKRSSKESSGRERENSVLSVDT